MSTIWNTIIYNPIYNALIFIAQHLTGQDVGLAVISPHYHYPFSTLSIE